MERRRLQGSLFAFFPQSSAKAIRLRTGFDNVSLVGESIEHGLAEPSIGKHLWPLRERQIGGHDNGRFFRPFGNDLKEKLGGHLGVATGVYQYSALQGRARSTHRPGSHYRNRFGVVSLSQNSAEKTQRVILGGVAVPFCFRFALRATLQQNGTLSS